MLCRVTQDGRVILESSDKTWSTGEGNGKPFQYSSLESPMNSMKRQKDRTLKDEFLRPVGAQYATGEQSRNNSRKNEEMEPKEKQHPAAMWLMMEARSDAVKSIGTWNVRSMNQGNLEVVKQDMVRVNVDILGVSELKWTGKCKFNSADHCIYYCGQESLRRNGVTITVNKRVQNAVLGCNHKKDSSFPRQTIQYYSYSSLCPKQ